jgi:hypothetical protein
VFLPDFAEFWIGITSRFVPLRICKISLPWEKQELAGFWENLLSALKTIAETTFSVKQGQSMTSLEMGYKVVSTN